MKFKALIKFFKKKILILLFKSYDFNYRVESTNLQDDCDHTQDKLIENKVGVSC